MTRVHNLELWLAWSLNPMLTTSSSRITWSFWPTSICVRAAQDRFGRIAKDGYVKTRWSSTSLDWVGRSRGSVVLDQDTGQTGSSQHGRCDLHTLLEAIITGKAGLVAARELSRLVRDNQDWGQLVRLCRFKQVLDGRRAPAL